MLFYSVEHFDLLHCIILFNNYLFVFLVIGILFLCCKIIFRLLHHILLSFSDVDHRYRKHSELTLHSCSMPSNISHSSKNICHQHCKYLNYKIMCLALYYKDKERHVILPRSFPLLVLIWNDRCVNVRCLKNYELSFPPSSLWYLRQSVIHS